MRSCSLLLAGLLSLLSTALVAQRPTTLPLWPNGAPEPFHTAGPERNTRTPQDHPAVGKPFIRLTDVSNPTLTVYSPPTTRNTGAAVLVFPGGGYKMLAWDLEGTEVCSWLNSIGVTCVLVKYRVPFDDHFPKNPADLEDAQQAMLITRSHATDWHIDQHRIGALGFSAGAHLAAVLSNHFDFKATNDPPTDISARPDFALIIYPGALTDSNDFSKPAAGITASSNTPPTFLVQAEDDPVHIENSIVYFLALKNAKVPAELHVFAQGGHGYGLRPSAFPISRWPALANDWLHTIQVLAPSASQRSISSQQN